MKKHFEYSFCKGLNQVRHGDAKNVKDEIFSLLGLADNYAMRYRKTHHYRDIPHHVYVGITEIFAKYGVKESDVWTVTEIQDDAE